MFISNENPTEVQVYFDDVTMTHTPTNIIQYNEYYPFGLQASTSWTRENNTNNYLYNRANELNTSSGWYDMFYRNYDAALGRMLQVDPYATMYSSHTPYNYALNSPALLNDPTGGYVYANAAADRINRINNRNDPHYMDGWYEDFSEYADAQGGVTGYDANGNFYTNNQDAIAALLEMVPSNPDNVDFTMSFLTEHEGLLYSVMMNYDRVGNVTGIGFARSNAEGQQLYEQMFFATDDVAGRTNNSPSNDDASIYDALGFGADVGELSRQGYGAVRFGTTVENAEKMLKYSSLIKSGTATAGRQVFNSSVAAIKTGGKALGVFSVGVSVVEFAVSDKSGADYARLGGGLIITGAAFIPVAGPFISIGLGLLDSAGAFDGVYGYFDK